MGSAGEESGGALGSAGWRCNPAPLLIGCVNLVALSCLTCQMRTVTPPALPSCSLSPPQTSSCPAHSTPLHPLPAVARDLPQTCSPHSASLLKPTCATHVGPTVSAEGWVMQLWPRKPLARHLLRLPRRCRASLPTALSLDEPLNLTLGGQSAKCNVTSRTQAGLPPPLFWTFYLYYCNPHAGYGRYQVFTLPPHQSCFAEETTETPLSPSANTRQRGEPSPAPPAGVSASLPATGSGLRHNPGSKPRVPGLGARPHRLVWK